jgi:type II secretory pathway pseudopilin PulG
MLVVIAIIAILASLLLPVLAGAKKAAQKKQAAMEISQIVGAIQQYDSVYGRFPVSSGSPSAQSAAAAATPPGDFTYGGVFTNAAGGAVPVYTTGYQTNNAEVIAILMDVTTNAVTHQNVNFSHAKNPQQTIFLNAKMSGYDPSSNDQHPPGGVDIAGVYRDPWGNPYVISMDLNYDEQCKDAFYSLTLVSSTSLPGNSSSGINGLINPDQTADNYQNHGKVMVWSAGPDGKIDNTLPADKGVNKDNILSWQ